jgi:hypothetical protein
MHVGLPRSLDHVPKQASILDIRISMANVGPLLHTEINNKGGRFLFPDFGPTANGSVPKAWRMQVN